MKQRIIILTIVLTVGLLSSVAENVIQVRPATTKPGVAAADKAILDFEMTNEEANIIAFEFKVKLPDGMDFVAIALDKTRFPYTEDFFGDKVYEHSVNYTKREDGWWYVIVTSTQLNPIKGTSGVVLKALYTTEGTMQPGIYPITIKETLMGISGTEKAETADVAVSYVAVSADGTVSPLTTDKDLDMNALVGYVPSFVMESLNSDIEANENLRSLKMTGATATGAELTVPENVVYETATTGGLKRTFTGGQKSTVCLPFALSEEQVTAVKEKGCAIEVLSGYNAEKSSVQFTDVTTMTAHTPYLVTVTGETSVALFEGLTGIEADLTATPIDVVQGALSMKGSYEKSTISSETGLARYAYDAEDGSFVRIGSNATLLPYRAYLELASSTAASRLVISDDETTGIENVNVNDNDNLNGNGNVNRNATFFDLQGRRIDEADAKGVYIKNGRKFIKK